MKLDCKLGVTREKHGNIGGPPGMKWIKTKYYSWSSIMWLYEIGWCIRKTLWCHRKKLWQIASRSRLNVHRSLRNLSGSQSFLNVSDVLHQSKRYLDENRVTVKYFSRSAHQKVADASGLLAKLHYIVGWPCSWYILVKHSSLRYFWMLFQLT
jgi:hypothetical protein